MPRYPWHFCKACRDLATDGTGRRLTFANTPVSGGFSCAVDGGDPVECGGALCLIHDRPVFVTEARFGGIVAQPVLAGGATEARHRVWDLTGEVPQGSNDETPEG
ncbi:hypothetical protein MN188_08805 [Aliiroseovarius sp. N1Y82]|uniref:hypothetical protein n=1 Tax=Aliiroseovarius subalbicans TaxID=2925840 RepID=UPI001F55DAA9|nr:hypothetical protein [Aliiroseovarius subalbicans]MCI2399485.1 hypothetical protein [Aliiroseovarius subalbicans]